MSCSSASGAARSSVSVALSSESSASAWTQAHSSQRKRSTQAHTGPCPLLAWPAFLQCYAQRQVMALAHQPSSTESQHIKTSIRGPMTALLVLMYDRISE
jgi:hypothetical protein